EDTVERIGIERSWAEIARADVVVHLQDARSAGDALDSDIARRLPGDAPILTVYNKVDLLDAQARAALAGTGERMQPSPLLVSAKSSEGLQDLRQSLLAIAGWNPGAESPWLARERHVQALEAARSHLQSAGGHAAQSDQVLDLFAEELRLAHEALCSITGQFTSDDLLGEIFSSFCIGK